MKTITIFIVILLLCIKNGKSLHMKFPYESDVQKLINSAVKSTTDSLTSTFTTTLNGIKQTATDIKSDSTAIKKFTDDAIKGTTDSVTSAQKLLAAVFSEFEPLKNLYIPITNFDFLTKCDVSNDKILKFLKDINIGITDQDLCKVKWIFGISKLKLFRTMIEKAIDNPEPDPSFIELGAYGRTQRCKIQNSISEAFSAACEITINFNAAIDEGGNFPFGLTAKEFQLLLAGIGSVLRFISGAMKIDCIMLGMNQQ